MTHSTSSTKPERGTKQSTRRGSPRKVFNVTQDSDRSFLSFVARARVYEFPTSSSPFSETPGVVDGTREDNEAKCQVEHVLLRLLLFAAETFKENLEDIVELLRDVGKAQHGKFWRPVAQCRLHPFDPAPLRRPPHPSVMSARAVGQLFYLEEPWLLRGG